MKLSLNRHAATPFRRAHAARWVSAGISFVLLTALVPTPGASAQTTTTPSLSFTASPSAADPGAVFDVAPTVTVTDSTDPVTLSVTGGAGEPSGKLTCPAATVTPVDGVATFPGCSIDKGGRYTLRASVGGVSGGGVSADSGVLRVSGPAYLTFGTQPTGGQAGDAWLGQPVVRVVDADGTLIATSTAKIGLVIKPGTGTGGAVVTCAEPKNATTAEGGLATFSGCSVDRAGEGFRLYAIDVDDGIFGTSAPFAVSAGPPAALRFDTQPGTGQAGQALGVQPQVAVVDALGNRVAAASASVTLRITAGTGDAAAVLACAQNPVAATTGLASFTGCAIDKTGSAYTLTASAPGLSSALSNAVHVSLGGVSQLTFATNPGGGPGGMPFATQPVVSVTDSGGNGAGGLVTLSIAPGSGATDAVLTCDATTVAANAGTATFTGCSIDRDSSVPYALVATVGNHAARSQNFTVTKGAPVSAEFTTDPSSGNGGSALASQPVVVIRDAGGNGAAGSVTLSLAAGFGTPGARLTCAGGSTVSAVGGTASFTGCRVDKAGAGYRLLATIDGAGVTRLSASFDIRVGGATHLAFTTQPGGGTGGVGWAAQPAVAVLDAGGNIVVDSGATIHLSVASGPGALSCGANPLAVSSGTATFAGCSIDTAGAGYRLTAAAAGLASASSAPFDVRVGVPARLVFTAQPSAGTAGRPLTRQPALAVVDAGGNRVAGSGGQVALAITAGTGTPGASLSCRLATVSAGGTATFGGCKVNQAGGGYALTATWQSFTAESLPFVVVRASTPPLEVAPVGAPLGQTMGGASLAPNPSAVVDDVNTATGALQRVFRDLEVAGVGMDLVLERTYNSGDTAVGAFGLGFSSILDMSVTVNPAGTEATVRGPDGQRIVFTGHQGSFTGPPGARADLTCTGNQKTCTVTHWDGTTWTVTGPRLDSYVDGTGQGLAFVRDSATQLRVKLTTTDKKSTYDVVLTLDAQGQVTHVRTPAERQISYGYTGGRLTSFTDARGKTWTYDYDAGQRLTRITDPSGEVRLAVAYDAAGRVATASSQGDARHTQNRFSYDTAAQTTTREARTTVGGTPTWVAYVDTYRSNVLVRQSLPSGAVLRYSYDARLNLTAVQDPNGFVQEWAFDANGDLVTQSTPLDSTTSAVVQFTYDRSHRMTSQTDALGNRTTYDYQGGRLTSITPPGGREGATTFSYAGPLLTEVATPIGRQTFVHDAMGNVVQVNEYGLSRSTLNGNGSRATYNEAGLKTSATDPRGVPENGPVDPAFTTTWTYDDAGNLLSTRSPVGVVTSFAYDSAADVVSSTDPSGTTSYAWHEASLTRTTTAPGGLVTTELYDPSANLLSQATPNGARTNYLNDAMGRPATVIDPSGRRTAITYDAMGQSVLFDDGSGSVVRQQYDALNRLIRQAAGDGQNLMRYDLAGRQLRLQDMTGAVTTRTYDARGNVTSVTDGAGTTAYRYDLADNPVSRTDGRGGVTTFSYDGMGRLTSQSVDGNTTTFVNNVAGQRISQVDPEGRTTAYGLDGANRVTRTTYSQGDLPQIVVDQTYDAQGRRASMSSGGVVSTYSYDARGNLTGAGPESQRFSYDFGTPGKVSETYPDGTHVTYDVDDAGALMRLDATSADGHVQASYLRDATRRVTAASMANGVVETRSYDPVGRVVGQSVQRAGTVMAGETYTYDSQGQRLSQRTTAAGRSVLNAYAYDATGRVSGFTSTSTSVPVPVVNADPGGARSTPPTGQLSVPVPASMDTGSKQPVGTPTGPAVTPGTTIAYDAVGNIVRNGDTAYSVGSADRITTQSGPAGSWTYDRSGAVTTMTSPRGTTTFSYDAAGRLSKATLQPPTGPATTITYGYDGDGNRISRTVGDATTQYVWDPNAAVPLLVLEKSGTTVLRRYFNDTAGPVAIQTPTQTYYVHRDPLGSTNQLTDAHGDVVAAYAYSAFGEVTSTGPAAAEADLLFQGQQRDPVTGLYNMRARTYDPVSGRFTQREPLATPAGAPLVAAYAFVGNRPTALTDPTGLMPQTAGEAGDMVTPATSNGVLASYSGKVAIAAKLFVKGLVKALPSLAKAAAASTHFGFIAAKEAQIAKGLKFASAGLAVLAIGLQTYVTVDNCMNGPVAQCVGSAVGLATNVAFVGICLGATAGIGAAGCALAGAAISIALETVITLYGPEIADAVVSAAEYAADLAVDIGNTIADTAKDVGGAIVSGFNDAGTAIASGFNGFVDTMNQAGQTAVQLAAELADAFDFGYQATAAALVGLGYDIQGLAEAFASVFSLTAQQAAQVMREAFFALATDVASALESAYGAAANVVAGVLRDAGYAVDEIVAGLHAAYQVTVTQLVELLGQLDYGVNQIASALSDVLDVTAEALAGVLKSLDYTVAQIGQSLQQVYELIDVAAAKVLDAVGYAVGEVASALHDVYRETAAIAARALEQAGFLVDEIATGLRDAYQATAAQVAQILKAIDFTAHQVAGALANVYAEAAQGVAALLTGAGYVVDDIARAMTDVFNQTANEVAAVLRTVGYAIGEITRVLDDVYAQTAQGVATILRSIGYGVNEIGAALQSVLNVTADAIVGVLRDAGYAIDAIGGVLESVYNQLADQAAATLRSAGYAIAEIGTVLHSVFQQAADGAARVLLAIGATAAEINTVLSNTFNQTVAAIGSLLSSLGFTNATIAAIGGAFTSFGNDVVDFFEGLFG
ncbi:MAG: hypothetical protein IPJ15_08125 [Actinomycetales bacterium]|nr:hypothetical protein [Candidatus Phosphoribacter baldrii]